MGSGNIRKGSRVWWWWFEINTESQSTKIKRPRWSMQLWTLWQWDTLSSPTKKKDKWIIDTLVQTDGSSTHPMDRKRPTSSQCRTYMMLMSCDFFLTGNAKRSTVQSYDRWAHNLIWRQNEADIRPSYDLTMISKLFLKQMMVVWCPGGSNYFPTIELFAVIQDRNPLLYWYLWPQHSSRFQQEHSDRHK